MDFANERYVRLYVRDTTTWKLLPWEAQALAPLILRLVDRAGVLDLAGVSPAEAVAAHLQKFPVDVIQVAVDALLEREVLEHRADALLWPKFLDGQEAVQSDRQRQAEARAKRRDLARMAELVTQRDQCVTKRDTVSRPVSETSRAVTPSFFPSVNKKKTPSVNATVVRESGSEGTGPRKNGSRLEATPGFVIDLWQRNFPENPLTRPGEEAAFDTNLRGRIAQHPSAGTWLHLVVDQLPRQPYLVHGDSKKPPISLAKLVENDRLFDKALNARYQPEKSVG